jgi:mannose-6-phosphate isomerase-like protein (cupin superfamily)
MARMIMIDDSSSKNSGWLEVTPGERMRFLTSSESTNGAYMVLECVADPRNGVPMHVHDNEEEHFIVVEGALHLVEGGRALDLTAGMAVTVKKGVPHAWCNLSGAPVRILCIFTPGRIEALFRSVSSGQDFDVAVLAAQHGTRIIGPALRDDLYSIMSPRR